MPNMHGHPPKAVPQACQAKGPSMVMMTTPLRILPHAL